ncbi:MAG: efflux RND transporter periplasmic adaptor subunit, partial [Armatimonadota bacterium]
MSENRRKRFPWVRIIVLAVLIVVAAIAYYFAWGPGSVPVVRAARVARGNLQVELSATGIVKADEIQVASEVPARIERVAVKENEQVRRGQVLVVLDRESLQAYLRQARADLEAAQAQARQAQQGVRAEEANARATIEAAQANLQAAEAQLQRLETGARPQEIRTAEERVAQTQAQLGQTRSDLARLEQLYGDGAVSQQALDQARTAHELAGAEMRAAQESLRLVREGARSEDIAAGRAQVAAARAGVAQARALERVVDLRRREHDAATALEERARAQLSAAQAELSRAEITAPMDATVVRVNADPGEVAYPGAPLMVLSDLSHMWVDAEIDDVDLDKITLEQEVNVLAEAFPGRSFKGRVYEIAKSAEPKMLGRVRAKIV